MKNYHLKYLYKIFILLIFLASTVFPQVIDKKQIQDYPLLFNLTWGGGCDWWQNQFGWNLTVYSDSIPVKRAQSAYGKRDSIYWSFTTDWNAGEPLNKLMTIPDEWYVRTASGSRIPYWGTYLVDPTNYCPQVNGKRYNEKLADTLAVFANPTIWDGINSDGTWAYPFQNLTDIDLDRNGLADYSETSHGSTSAERQAWICRTWAAGYYTLANRLRSKPGWSNKLLTYWTVKDSMGMHAFNGGGWENAPQNAPVTFDVPFSDASLNGYNNAKQIFDVWNSTTPAPSPRMNFLCASMQPDGGTKSWYRYMRWTLGMAILTDAYYSIQEADAQSGVYDHAAVFYYDEYVSHLGKPTSLPQKLPNGVWVRFFTNGAMILNTRSTAQTVTDANLRAVVGYSGPYYRLYGNQDTTWNNGTAFTSVTLTTTTSVRWQQPIGDMILLKKTQDTAICPIVVDNSYTGTTPGSATAVLTNFVWDNQANSGTALDYNPTYNVGYRVSTDPRWYRSHRANAGAGDATAIYTPGINRAGYWRVYEWHGWAGTTTNSYAEATNVPCRINYNGGYKDTTINQQINSGRWNLLGTFPYSPTGNKMLTITNRANGVVIADAFKWEFVTSPTSQGSTPPFTKPPTPLNPPDGALNQPTTIRLYWTSVVNAQSYRLKLSTDSLFDSRNIIVDDSTLTDTSLQITNLNLNKKYYWCVSVKSAEGVSSFSAIQNFTTYVSGSGLIEVIKGWNMISVPFHVPDPRKTTLFPTSTSAMFGYDGAMIEYDTLKHGRGYWLKFDYPQIIGVSGTPVTSDTINLKEGWNLIGSISTPVFFTNFRTDQPDMVLSLPYKLQGSYVIDSVIQPGVGYWIKANKDGALFLSSSSLAAKSYPIKFIHITDKPPATPDESQGISDLDNIKYSLLAQNYPNPFNSSTVISFVLPAFSNVTLKIYNVLGQEVAVLIDNQSLDTGIHQVDFSPASASKNYECGSGIYFYRIIAQSQQQTLISIDKMLLLK